MTVVSMVSALDALVEELVPRAREMLVEHQVRASMGRAREQEPEAAARVGDAALEAIRRAAQKVLDERLGSFDASPRGAGAERWEDVLRNAGLQAPPERPIPADLDQALTEAVAPEPHSQRLNRRARLPHHPLQVPHPAADLAVPRVAHRLPERRRDLIPVPDEGRDAVGALPAQVLLASAHERQADAAALRRVRLRLVEAFESFVAVALEAEDFVVSGGVKFRVKLPTRKGRLYRGTDPRLRGRSRRRLR